MSANVWLQMIENNPGHSDWYIERFRQMAAEGNDLDGEARFIDAMVPRGSDSEAPLSRPRRAGSGGR